MSSESLTVILAVGLIAGWLAGQILHGTGYGIINDLIIGVVGSFYRRVVAASTRHPPRRWHHRCSHQRHYRRGVAPFGSKTRSRWEAAGTADGVDDGAGIASAIIAVCELDARGRA